MNAVKENVAIGDDGGILGSLKDYLPSDILQNEKLKEYRGKGVDFLREVNVTLPNDGNYKPRPYDGATKLATGFHNIPRGGNTNDIVSLSRFGGSDNEMDPTAEEYVTGIIVISLVMALIYILWGLFLLLLRVGRFGDCCTCGQRFIAKLRAQGGCCIQRHLCGWLSGRTPKRPTKASIKRDQEYRANGIVQKSIDVITSSVASTTTAGNKGGGGKQNNENTTVAKDQQEDDVVGGGGGGGRGGEAPREKEEIVPVQVEEELASSHADPPIDDNNNKHPPPQQQCDPSLGSSEVKPKNSEHEEELDNNKNNNKESTTKAEGDAAPPPEKIAGEKDSNKNDQDNNNNKTANNTDDEEEISDEYLANLQKREERHMIAIRVSFLFWGIIVIIACIMLSISGFGVADRLVDSTQHTLGRFENYLETIIDNCDEFLNRTAEARQAREQFLSKFENINSTNTSERLCPNFPKGIFNMSVNLGQLFEGPLIKLAEVRDTATNKTSITVVSFLDDTFLGSALDIDFARLKRIVKEKLEQGKGVASSIAQGDVSIAEVATNVIPDGTVQTVTEAVQDLEGAIETIKENGQGLVNETLEAVTTIKETGQGLVNQTGDAVGEVLDDVLPEVGEVVQSVTETGQGLINQTVGIGNEGLDNVIPEAGDAVESITGATQNLVNQTVQAVTKEGGSRRMQEANEIVSIGGEAASFTIIGDPSAYKNNLSAILATNFTLEVNFIEIAERVNTKLSSKDFQVIGEKVYTLRNGLQFVLDTLQDASNSMEEYMPFWFAAVGFAAVLALFVLFMMVGTILAWMGNQPAIFRNVNDCVILPIFIFVGHLLWVATCTFLVLGIITGDLCFSNPDEQIVQVLNNTLEPRSTIAYNFAFFYLTGCNPVDRPLLWEFLLAGLLETRKAGADLFNMLTSLGPGPLGRACGNDINLLRSVSAFLALRVELSLEILTSVAKASTCKSLHPLIADLTYDILCTDIMKMMGPMFFSLFLVSIGSMVMVTLRVAWHELKDDLGDEDVEQESSCCRLGCGGQGKNDKQDSAGEESREQAMAKSE